ncbi:MAG: hypothetical protein MUP16_05465 [Sedimentisphaerales bacterium]|nr:hypothetical protein [Sedimentisphaerales bacterium]
MIKILKWFNDNHWYVIAGLIIAGMLFWTYGCESKVLSLLDSNKQVNRSELKVELEYVVGIAGTRVDDLDRQDEIKTALFNAITLISQGGQVNSMGVLNLAATIGAIGWGLNRNQALKKATA